LPSAVGLIAGCLSTWSFVPQVLKIWREGETGAISFRTFALRGFGSLLWTIYGCGIGSLPVVIFSASNVALCVTVLVLKVRTAKAPQPA
jgi:MtN3 and saliva related transmembrane protein